ncbi:MAG TPA: glycosyltransferase family 4 protein [Phycisphaerae bacterium]|nr:glycosyltransferase family 4 protein [Phycisphaerae bacterium]
MPPAKAAIGRRVAVLAVHHVQVGDRIFTGGAEKYIQTVVGALLDTGASVHVGYSGTSIYDALEKRCDSDRLTVERTGWLNETLGGDGSLTWSVLRSRRGWLRATGADTIFAVQQASGAAFSASLLAARLGGMRVVQSIRQSPEPMPVAGARRWLGVLPAPQFWKRRMRRRYRFPAACCHAVIFNSRRVAEAFERDYGFSRRRSRVIPNGELIRDEAFRPSPGSRPRIGSVGRVTHAKGADLLMDAFAIIAGRHPGAALTYFGDGDLIPGLSAHARAMGLAERVRFAGYVASRDAIYRSIDICVQLSRRESMSNSVVEAQARGIPCIVTEVGGLPETVEDGLTGYVVPRDHARACAEAICGLLASPERYEQFSRNAATRARREFDLATLMRKTVSTILGI